MARRRSAARCRRRPSSRRAALNATFGVQPSCVRALVAVAEQMIDFGRPDERGIGADVLLPVEAGVPERDLDELLHGVADAGGDDVVVGLILLQHEPHRVDVVLREAPVALRLEVAHGQRAATARA